MKKAITHLRVAGLLFACLLTAQLGIAQLSGTYTIGGASPDYTSINAARAAVYSSGVSGPVTFNIRTGTYVESMVFSGTPSGASATNTVTFQSESGNAADVVVRRASSYIFYLRSARYFNFRNMTVRARSYSFLMDRTVDCEITGNIISPDAGLGAYGIYMTSSNNRLRVADNRITSFQYGIYDRSGNSSTRIEGNEFVNQRIFAIFSTASRGLTISGNEVQGAGSLSSTYYGFYIRTALSALNISKNVININQTRSRSVIGMYVIDTRHPSTNITNNMVSISAPLATPFGMRLDRLRYGNVEHNTINMYRARSFAYGLLMPNNFPVSLNIRNNISHLDNGTRRGYAFYWRGSLARTTIDYNNWSNENPGYYTYVNGNRPNLASHQASGADPNGMDLNPSFVSNTDLHLATTGGLRFAPNVGVPDDIDDDPRGPLTTVGADEACPEIIVATNECVSILTGFGIVESATLTASASGGDAPYTYAWSNGATGASITVSPTVTTTYTVTATDNNGCESDKPGSVTVIVTDVTSCHPGGMKVMICHVPPGNPANEHTICVAQSAAPAHIAAAGTGGHGTCRYGPCEDPCEALPSSLPPAAPSAKQGSADGYSVTVYPNPSTGEFNVELQNTGAQSFEYEVWTTDGRMVTKGSAAAQFSKFDISNEADGIYFLRITAGDIVINQKLIKR